jgi:hypothetical protein
MTAVGRAEIEAARRLLSSVLAPTPIQGARWLSQQVGVQIAGIHALPLRQHALLGKRRVDERAVAPEHLRVAVR